MSVFRDYNFGYNKPETDWAELRRRANANLKKIGDGVYRREADAKRKTKRPEVDADMIESGHMVIELRELTKLERKISRAADRDFKDSDYDQGMWEEVDHRIEALQEALKAHSKAELTRFVRAYNKSIRPPGQARRTKLRGM